MDVRINRVTSNIQLVDSSSLLAPEVLEEIIRSVLQRLDEEEQRRIERESDQAIETRAARLNRGIE